MSEQAGTADALAVGYVLDGAVALGMGWRNDRLRDGALWWTTPETPNKRQVLPVFSDTIAAAWDAVEWLRARGWRFFLHEEVFGHNQRGQWRASFYHGGRNVMVRAFGATAPEAICRAFLEAVKSGVI